MIQTKNPWVLADKPSEISVDELARIDKYESGEYIATTKVDGYRALVDFSDEITVSSRRDLAKGGPSKIPIKIIDSVNQFKEENSIAEGTRLDAEWTSLRASSLGREKLFIFGIYFLGDKYLGKKPESYRFDLIKEFKYNDDIVLVDNVDDNYVDFYFKSKLDPIYEGIVLKYKNSILNGDREKCTDNPFWLKCKWRAGDAGDTLRDDSNITILE